MYENIIDLTSKEFLLDDAVNAYWGEILPLDNLKPLPEQFELINKQLRQKYGNDVIDKFDILSNDFYSSYIGRKKFIDYAYGTGLYREISPNYSFEGREILKVLINKLSDTPPRSLFDVGCADLQIGLGLAIYLPKLDMNIYGVDDSVCANKLAQTYIDKYYKQNNLTGEIIVENLDYININAVSSFMKRYSSIDTVLFSRPDNFFDAEDFIIQMRSNNKKVIGSFACGKERDYDLETNIILFQDAINYGAYSTRFVPTHVKEVNYRIILVGEFETY